jgi:hypothetical protein
MGGAAPVASLRIAAAAAVHGGRQRRADSRRLERLLRGARARDDRDDVASLPGGKIARDYYMPFGLTAPPQWYALMARRHMHEFGTTPSSSARSRSRCASTRS